jgi:uncharacterized membrane protein YeaQ/YmgE (transglycosylase-associated protein family)
MESLIMTLIVGGIVGWLFGALGLGAYGLVGRLIMHVAGAAILIAILKAINVYR